MEKQAKGHDSQSRPLRILLWHWGRRGGGPRYTLELTKALAERDDVEVSLSLSKYCEILDDFAGIGVSRFDVETYHGFGNALFSSLRLPWLRYQFWRFVELNQIDLVICTMSHLWNLAVLFRKPTNIKFALVLHDAVPHPGENYLFRYPMLKAEAQHADTVIALTEHVRELMCMKYPYSEDRCHVVPHGVFANGAPIPSGQRSPVRLLFFGRMIAYKGLDLLLDAHQLLRERKVDLHLHIAGPGDMSGYHKRIEGLDRISVDNRWIPEDEIGKIFAATDISVLPYREASQSGVIAASFGAGVPVVATPVGGLSEQVRHGENGLVCDKVDAVCLADSIEQMVYDDTLRSHCANGALRSASSELSWCRIAQKFVEISNQTCLPGGT